MDGVIAAGGLTFLIDRTARAGALRLLRDGRILGLGALALRLVRSERPLFGWAPSRRGLIALWVVAAACAGLAAAAAPSTRAEELCAGLGVALGGAASNLYDRISERSVVDYIAVGRWPAFNFADLAIVAGAAVAVVSIFA